MKLKPITLCNNAWTVTHIGVAIFALYLGIKPESYKDIIHYSGYAALFHLVLVLALNPLRVLFETSIFLKKLNRYRREIGVACFSYSLVHLACFIVKRGGLSETLKFLLHPALISVFFISFPILFLLTLTSNNVSIKQLGFLKWKRLHNTVYLAEIGVFIHMLMLGAIKLALSTLIPLVIFQYQRKRKKRLQSIQINSLFSNLSKH